MNDEESLPPPIWVDRVASLRAMLAHLKGEPALAIDTESNSLYVYQEQVCLIQISVPGTDYLVDTLALGDLSGLGPLLAAPDVLKVFHGAEYDLSVLYRDYGFTVDNLFDTMWASRILGWPAHGLAALLKAHFGVHLNKKYQRANWGLRPLPPEQRNYARLDSHYLLALQKIQARELMETNRWRQAEHRFAKLTRTRSEPKVFHPDDFWRLSGVRDLDDVGRGVLRELFIFRDDYARARNRPPFKIMSNKALLALSEQRPAETRGMSKIKGVPSWLIRKRGRQMLAAIRRGMERPISWEARPNTHTGSNGRGASRGKGRGNGRPSATCQARFEALRAWRNATAEARGVEPDIVMTNQTLWAVAHRYPRKRADLTGDGLLALWQVDEYGEAVLAVVKEAQ